MGAAAAVGVVVAAVVVGVVGEMKLKPHFDVLHLEASRQADLKEGH